MDDIVQFLNIIASIAVIIAAFYTYKAVKIANITLKANIIESIRENYSKTEMLEAMRALRDFKKEIGNDRKKLHDVYYEFEMTKNERFEKLNKNRRIVSHHFQKICKYEKEKIINKDLMKSLAEEFEVEFFLEVIEPLEWRINNPKYNADCYDKYRDLFPELGNKYPKMIF